MGCMQLLQNSISTNKSKLTDFLGIAKIELSQIRWDIFSCSTALSDDCSTQNIRGAFTAFATNISAAANAEMLMLNHVETIYGS